MSYSGYSSFPGSRSINWNGGGATSRITSRRESDIDPLTRSSSRRTGSSRYGDRSTSNYSHGQGRDYLTSSRDATAGASRYEDRGSSHYEDVHAIYELERADRERRGRDRDRDRTYGSAYNNSRDYRRSSNYERDREHEARRAATAGMHESSYDSRKAYGSRTARDSTSTRYYREAEPQARAGAREEPRRDSRFEREYPGFTRSSCEGRYRWSPEDYW